MKVIYYLKWFLFGLWDERNYLVYHIKELVKDLHELALRRTKVSQNE